MALKVREHMTGGTSSERKHMDRFGRDPSSPCLVLRRLWESVKLKTGRMADSPGMVQMYKESSITTLVRRLIFPVAHGAGGSEAKQGDGRWHRPLHLSAIDREIMRLARALALPIRR
ncbi:hypothetical protein SKAU_G00263510 [Synaphobranchus kaupii]|uniref:Uncharacterized protein n=1 Tax=Synaphobranchus kaupii TaxID=118154 RepID=A0A9Q1IPM7_SYNKA|nr:hypothetical protein SKAU_G00263510 [Synaphobranchus kaupii]